MELNLALDPDDAARFLRLPVLAAAQRQRPVQQNIVWHDSADAALATNGLALARERGSWRLEQLAPAASDLWPPGASPPVVAQAPTLEQLGHNLPVPMVPVVALAGRRQALVLETADGAVTVTVLRGMLRAVTTEHAVCRINLAGNDRAVLQAALNIAAGVPANIASQTLAGFALTTARGVPLACRRGAPELPDGLDIAHAFAFVLAHLTDVLLDFAPKAVIDTGDPEPIHQMRVALRRLRSAINVFQRALDCDELRAVKTDLKALNVRLGAARDWDVFVGETLSAVQAAFQSDPRLRRLVNAAARRRHECHCVLRAFLQSHDFRRMAIVLAWLAGAQCWRPLPGDATAESLSLQDFAAAVLERRSRKLASTDDIAALDPAELHAVRLKAKHIRYAAEIFAPIFSGKSRRFIHRLTTLQNLLGGLNDGATAHRLLEEVGGVAGKHAYASGLVLGFIAARSAGLLPQVTRRWSKLRRSGGFWD